MHKLGYSYTSEHLKLQEYQALKEKLESHEKLAEIAHSKLKEDFENELENQEKVIDPQEIQNTLLNSKLIKDIYSQFSDFSNTIKKLEQSIKKSLAEQKTTIINEVLNLIDRNSFEMLTTHNLKFKSAPGEAGMILNEDEINKIINGLDQNKITITKDIIQLLYDKGLFDSFPNKDQVFEKYLTFSEAYLLEKYGKTIPTSDGEYYLSDLEYSTRETILKSLKKDSYIDIVDMRHRMKLTPTEINFVLY